MSRLKDEDSGVWRRGIVALAWVALAGVVWLFLPALADGRLTLWAHDASLEGHKQVVDSIRSLGGFFWTHGMTLGGGAASGCLLNPSWLTCALLPPQTSLWLNIAVHILIAVAGGYFCARILGLSIHAAAVSGVAFGFTSHFVTLLGAGHIGKLQCIPWLPWVFGLFWRGWERGRWLDFLYCAMAYACMWLSGEPQIPYYLGWYLAGIALAWSLRAIRRRAVEPVRAAWLIRGGLSVACLIMTVLLAWQGLSLFLGSYLNVRPATVTPVETSSNGDPGGGAETAEMTSAKEKAAYEFATSWSLPPEETLTFLMSGQLFGVKSPLYWGRMGTETLHMTQVDHYMGFLVCILAVAAFGRLPRKRWTRLFLLLMLVSSLFIAYGKYTPLYRLIYELPTMASQRIPSRWVAITAFAISMLAGFGYERLFERYTRPADRRRAWALPCGLGLTGVALLVLAGVLNAGRAGLVKGLFAGMEGGAALAPMRASAFVSAFACSGVMALGCAALFAVRTWLSGRSSVTCPGNPARRIDWCWLGCLAMVMVDLNVNNKRYIEFFDWRQFFQADPIVQFFAAANDRSRVQPLATQQHPYLNRFVSFLAPWYDIWLTEPAAMSRVSPEYEEIFDRLSKQANYRFNARYYDMMGVRYVLSAVELPASMLPVVQLRLVQTFPFNGLPPLFLYEYAGYRPHPYFAGSAISVGSRGVALDRFAAPEFDPHACVIGVDIPGHGSGGQGTVQVSEYGRRHIRLDAASDKDGWVVLKMKFDPFWLVEVDGVPAKAYQVNGLHCGVPVAGGRHHVVLTYRPPRTVFLVSVYAWGIVFAGLALLGIGNARRRARNLPEA